MLVVLFALPIFGIFRFTKVLFGQCLLIVYLIVDDCGDLILQLRKNRRNDEADILTLYFAC